MNFEERIANKYSNFTSKDKKIIEYTINHPKEVTDSTMQQLSETLNTTVSAVQRVVKKLGYEGFAEFKLQIRDFELKNEEVENGTPENATMTVLNQYQTAIDRLKNFDIDDQIAEVAQLLHEKNFVKSIGIGSTSLPAMQLVYSLYEQGKHIEGMQNETPFFYLSDVMDENYLLIIFSVSANESIYLPLVEDAKKLGATTVLVTLNTESTLQTDYKFVLPSNSSPITRQKHIRQANNRLGLYIFSEILVYAYARLMDKEGEGKSDKEM